MSTNEKHPEVTHLIQTHLDLGNVFTYNASVYLGKRFNALWFKGARGYGEHVWTNINNRSYG